MAAKKKLTSEQKITVAKCVADPIYFITTQCYIQTTEHGLVPFALFDYQKDLIRDFIRFVSIEEIVLHSLVSVLNCSSVIYPIL